MSTATEVRAKLQDKVNRYSARSNLEPLSEGMKGAIVGELNRKLGGDLNRKVCIGWIFIGAATPISTKELAISHWYALNEWTGIHHDDESGWQSTPTFLVESASVLTAALKSYLAMNPGLALERMVLDSPVVASALSMTGGEISVVQTLLETDDDGCIDEPGPIDGGDKIGDPPQVPS